MTTLDVEILHLTSAIKQLRELMYNKSLSTSEKGNDFNNLEKARDALKYVLSKKLIEKHLGES